MTKDLGAGVGQAKTEIKKRQSQEKGSYFQRKTWRLVKC